MGKLAAVGWILAVLIGGVSFLGYQWLAGERQTALEAQATEYEAKLAKVKADADAMVQKIKDDATARETSLQTELDFQKMPDLPLRLAFRGNQVLYVESEAADTFACKVALKRPSTNATAELNFSINSRAFKDLAAIETWMFEKGDVIEFNKPGFKPWKGTFP